MIIAKVNGKKITSEQLVCESVFINMRHNDISAEELKKRALKNLIEAELVTQAAGKMGITVEEHEVDDAFIDVLTQFCTEEKYRQKLEEMQLTEDELRDRLEMHVRVEKYLQGRFECIDEECEEKMKAFFESNRELFRTDVRAKVSHILVRGECSNALETAQQIRARIKTEKDFEEEAKVNSCCPSCMKNGDLGFVLHGQLMPELDEEIFKLKSGDLSEIIKTKFGYHIFYIKEFEQPRDLDFHEVKHLLKKYRKKLYFEMNVEKHYAKLRKEADIKIL